MEKFETKATAERLLDLWGISIEQLADLVDDGLKMFQFDEFGSDFRPVRVENGKVLDVICEDYRYGINVLDSLRSLSARKRLCDVFFWREDIERTAEKWGLSFANGAADQVGAEPNNQTADDPHATGDENPLNGKERSELGRLRREKENWDKSIKAAVIVTEFCVKHSEPVIREQGRASIGFDIPNTTFEKIWGNIPGKYRKTSGRPKNP